MAEENPAARTNLHLGSRSSMKQTSRDPEHNNGARLFDRSDCSRPIVTNADNPFCTKDLFEFAGFTIKSIRTACVRARTHMELPL